MRFHVTAKLINKTLNMPFNRDHILSKISVPHEMIYADINVVKRLSK